MAADAVKKKVKGQHGGVRYSTKPKCGAKTNKEFNGERPCQRRAGFGTDHVGRGRCKLHGGCNPIKHGRYAKVLPTAALTAYESALDDPSTKDLTHELALMSSYVIPAALKRGTKAPTRQGQIDPLALTADCLEIKSKMLKRMHEIEDSQKIKFSASGLEMLVVEIVTVVSEFVDANTLRKITARLGTRALPA